MSVPAAAGDVSALVYIVDEDSAVRSALSLLVRTCGWNALAFADREELLAALTEARPACIVLGLERRDREDVSMLREISRLALGIPVILIAPFENYPPVRRAGDDGVTVVITKPLLGDELIKALSRAVAPVV